MWHTVCITVVRTELSVACIVAPFFRCNRFNPANIPVTMKNAAVVFCLLIDFPVLSTVCSLERHWSRRRIKHWCNNYYVTSYFHCFLGLGSSQNLAYNSPSPLPISLSWHPPPKSGSWVLGLGHCRHRGRLCGARGTRVPQMFWP